MSAGILINALRALADELYRLRDAAQGDGPTPKHLDHAALSLEVLAHIVNGKTVEQAFGAPGDWGYSTPIGKGLLAALRDGGFAVGLAWQSVDDDIPDDDVTVCVSVRDPDGECYFHVGHRSGGKWVGEDDLETPFLGEVYAWAEVPPAAPEKGGAK